MNSNRDLVKTVVRNIQRLRTFNGERYGKGLLAATMGSMQVLDLSDCEALHNHGLLEDDKDKLYRIPHEVVECFRYWGAPSPAAPDYRMLDTSIRTTLRLACYRSMEAVRELEKVARSPKPVEMDPVAFEILKDPMLLRGEQSDPVISTKVRQFFNQFPTAASAIYWLEPVKPEGKQDLQAMMDSGF